jgi:AraC-like DNA-binding protein
MIISIQEMPRRDSDYFRYFSPSSELGTWGLGVTACGRGRIAPGSPYPPTRHPEDHHFDWAHGRVLEALQIVLIVSGRGRLEYRGRPTDVVKAGSAFALPPHVWHRYRPDVETGWEESWVEIQGPTVERLVKAKAFSPGDRFRPKVPRGDLELALEAVHDRARSAGPGFDATLAAAAFAVLAAWFTTKSATEELPHLKRAVLEAERELAERHTEPVNMEELAKRLGVAYSHFRRAFKLHTGFAPWQYVMNLRLTRARRLLAAGDPTIEDVAARLGFSSAFHLSAAFKQAYGVAPDTWRRRLRSTG